MTALDANGIVRLHGLGALRDVLDNDAYPVTCLPTECSVAEQPAENDFKRPDTPSTKSVLSLWWHGESEPGADRTWLVDDLLPEVGTAIIAGPWGTYKTFIAIDLALSSMTRDSFAGRRVNKRCGVLYIAAEGASEIPLRIQAAYEESNNDGSPLPFARADQCVRLLDRGAPLVLTATAKAVDNRLRSKHDLGLGLIIIDTMAAAAGFNDENSNAEVQRAMNVCADLAKQFQCLVVVVDHFGKAVETGTRGGSAKEGSADAVLAILADRDRSGNVSGPRLAVRKVRGAATGGEIPFAVKPVKVGVDKNGKAQTTLVIGWGSEGAPAVRQPADPWPKHLRVFRDCLNNALIEFGADMRPFLDGPLVRTVDAEHVREEFYRRYPADGDTEHKKQATRCKAYNRATKDAQERRLIAVRVIEGKTFIWKIAPEGERGERDSQDTSPAFVPDVPIEEDAIASGGTGNSGTFQEAK